MTATRIVTLLLVVSLLFFAACDSDMPPLPDDPPAPGEDVDTNLVGQATGVDDQRFSEPEFELTPETVEKPGAIEVRSDDTIVWSSGYVSIDGSTWSEFSLEGERVSQSNWLRAGANAQVPIGADAQVGDNNYVILYSCELFANSWDCRENKWQIATFTIESTCEEGEIINNQICTNGELIPLPEAPERPGIIGGEDRVYPGQNFSIQQGDVLSTFELIEIDEDDQVVVFENVVSEIRIHASYGMPTVDTPDSYTYPVGMLRLRGGQFQFSVVTDTSRAYILKPVRWEPTRPLTIRDFPEFVEDDKLQIVVGEQGPSEHVIVATELISQIRSSGEIPVPSQSNFVVLDSEFDVDEIEGKHTIVIGSVCVNTITANLRGNPPSCTPNYDRDEIQLEIVEVQDGAYILIEEHSDTGVLLDFIRSDYEDLLNQVRSTQACVTVSDEISVREGSCAEEEVHLANFPNFLHQENIEIVSGEGRANEQAVVSELESIITNQLPNSNVATYTDSAYNITSAQEEKSVILVSARCNNNVVMQLIGGTCEEMNEEPLFPVGNQVLVLIEPGQNEGDLMLIIGGSSGVLDEFVSQGAQELFEKSRSVPVRNRFSSACYTLENGEFVIYGRDCDDRPFDPTQDIELEDLVPVVDGTGYRAVVFMDYLDSDSQQYDSTITNFVENTGGSLYVNPTPTRGSVFSYRLAARVACVNTHAPEHVVELHSYYMENALDEQEKPDQNVFEQDIQQILSLSQEQSEEVSRCLAGSEGSWRVQELLAQAEDAGVSAVPSTLFYRPYVEDWRQVPGDISYNSLIAATRGFIPETTFHEVAVQEGQFIGQVAQIITSQSLDYLDSRITTQEGTTDVQEVITMPRTQGGRIFTTDNNRGEAGEYLVYNDNSEVFTHTLRFTEGLESDIDNGQQLEDLIDEEIRILGEPYTVTQATVDADEGLSLTLLTGRIADTLESLNGNTRSRIYTLANGNEYEMRPIEFKEEQQVRFQINGQTTPFLTEGQLIEFGGTTIGIRQVITTNTCLNGTGTNRGTIELSIDGASAGTGMTLANGEERVVSFDGREYTVGAVVFSEQGARFTINGQLTDTLDNRESEVMNGLRIRFIEQIEQAQCLEEETNGIVEFYLDTTELEFEGLKPYENARVYINNEEIQEASAVANYSADFNIVINSIEYTLRADPARGSTVYVGEYEALSDHVDNPEALLGLDIINQGRSPTGAYTIRIQ